MPGNKEGGKGSAATFCTSTPMGDTYLSLNYLVFGNEHAAGSSEGRVHIDNPLPCIRRESLEGPKGISNLPEICPHEPDNVRCTEPCIIAHVEAPR